MIPFNSDRINIIEIIETYGKQSLYVINVYLPRQACKISDFKKHVDILEEMVNDCRSSGEVIIVGDMNSHFGKDLGSRFSGKSTSNATYLNMCIKRCNLIIMDGDKNICSGPCHTFNVPGVGRSYIDHCVATPMIASYTNGIRILEDCVINTSDHLPVLISLNIHKSKIADYKCNVLPRFIIMSLNIAKWR